VITPVDIYKPSTSINTISVQCIYYLCIFKRSQVIKHIVCPLKADCRFTARWCRRPEETSWFYLVIPDSCRFICCLNCLVITYHHSRGTFIIWDSGIGADVLSLGFSTFSLPQKAHPGATTHVVWALNQLYPTFHWRRVRVYTRNLSNKSKSLYFTHVRYAAAHSIKL
jgi:hypothetical protein